MVRAPRIAIVTKDMETVWLKQVDAGIRFANTVGELIAYANATESDREPEVEWGQIKYLLSKDDSGEYHKLSNNDTFRRPDETEEGFMTLFYVEPVPIKYIDRYYQNGNLYKIKFKQQGWQPGENTLLYCPLDIVNGTNDVSGHYTMSSGTIVIKDGVECFYGGKNSNQITTSTDFPYSPTDIFTVNCWGRCDVTNTNLDFVNMWTDGPSMYKFYVANNSAYRGGDTNYGTIVSSPQIGFHNYCVVFNASTYPIIYIDGIEVTKTNTSFRTAHLTSGPLSILGSSHSGTTGWVSRVIIEDKARTQEEVLNYYNQTKSLYGIQ